MVVSAVIGGVGSVVGGIVGSSASKSAAKTQAQASQASSDNQMAMLDKEIALQEPFRQGGLAAQNSLLGYLGLGGDGGASTAGATGAGAGGATFTNADFQEDPGYQFRQDQAAKAVQASAAARGSLMSGNTLKGIADYSQNIASEEYNNAFNRYQTERQNTINPLLSIMGDGQTATNQDTAATGTAANTISNNITDAGQATAAGTVGSANAITGALGGVANSASNYFSTPKLLSYIGKGG